MRSWTTRHWLWAAAAAVVTAVVTGTTPVLIPNPVFTRMVEAPWWTYPVWIASAVLSGLLIATYAADRSSAEHRQSERRSITGAVLSFLAVGSRRATSWWSSHWAPMARSPGSAPCSQY
uniref:hypothetical protein n=1 Tax=Saccharopolyspora galaxeae TaxID=2781241 RepID=UPI00190AE017|nr:hypothetical protein [Saccharopolyspora sp. HNM0986]